MKRILRSTLYAALALGVSTAPLFAQSPSPSPSPSVGPGGEPPPPGRHGPPPSPLFKALDANHDGVISADEIANASAVLQKLAGSSGQITHDSLRPPRPDGNGDQPNDKPRGRGPDGEDRPHHRPPPPDAQGSPNASADGPSSPGPRPQHRPEGREHLPPPPDGAQPQAKPAGSPGTSPTASPAGGPPDGPDGRRHGPPHGDRLFDFLDTNRDGVIDASEIANAATALKKADTNGDGQIDHQDMRPPPPPPGPEQ